MTDHSEAPKPIKRRVFSSRRSGVGTGTTSLLMIFTVLCFATLALLSLSTAATNRRIQQRGQQAATSFALAQGDSAKKLSEIDEVLAELQTQDLGDPVYFTQAAARLELLGCTAGKNTNEMEFTLPIDEFNVLKVNFTINSQQDTHRFTLQRQISERIGEWEPEDNGILWPGN